MDETPFDPFSGGAGGRLLDELRVTGIAVIADALGPAAEPGRSRLGADEGARAMAAAEVVAALRGAPAPRLPRAVSEWVDGEAHQLDDELVATAKAAVLRVGAEGSALAERADADGDGTAWRAALTDLHQRLG